MIYHRVLRLKDYNYAQAGAYFVTICTEARRCCLGRVVEGSIRLDQPGQITQAVWDRLPQRFHGLELDEMVVMPNHVHGILFLADEPSPPLGEVIRSFKAASTRLIRSTCLPDFAWQRNFYEHVIRSEPELNRIREYILSNPMRWHLDHEILNGRAKPQRGRRAR